MTIGYPTTDNSFQHRWQAQILLARPLILPPRHFTYPNDAEEVERGALELLIHPVRERANGFISPSAQEFTPEFEQEFLATCALGFRDPAVPTGLWSAPNPKEICAVSGGYAYLIDTSAPQRFTMIPYRPVLEVRALPSNELLLFVGHHKILAWGRNGQEWESPKLSDEGLTITSIDGHALTGLGWHMLTDTEALFAVDLRTGAKTV